MANLNWEHVDVFSHNCKITGSIAKVCSVSGQPTTIEDYTTGRFVRSDVNTDINASPNITSISGSAQTTDIIISGSYCVDGPFIAIHLKDDNPTAIYHSGIFNVVDPD